MERFAACLIASFKERSLRAAIDSRHGPIVAFGYWLCGLLRCVTFTHIWRLLSDRPGHRFRDRIYDKSTPTWKDLGVIVLLLLTALVTMTGIYDTIPRALVRLASMYLIFDVMITHINELWFDSLTPGPAAERRVWSHLRLLTQAFIGFAETIFLFGVLYLYEMPERGLRGYLEYGLLFSFSTATTFNFERSFLGDAPLPTMNAIHLLWALQIFLSLFFILLVITIMANQGYARKEITDQEYAGHKAARR